MPCLYFIYSSKLDVHVHSRKNYATVEIHPKGQDPPYWACIFDVHATQNFSLALPQAAR